MLSFDTCILKVEINAQPSGTAAFNTFNQFEGTFEHVQSCCSQGLEKAASQWMSFEVVLTAPFKSFLKIRNLG